MRAGLHKVETRSEAEILASCRGLVRGGERGRCQALIFKPKALRDRLDDRHSVALLAGGSTPIRGHFGRQLSDTLDSLDRLVLGDDTLFHEQMDETFAEHQSDLAVRLSRFHDCSPLESKNWRSHRKWSPLICQSTPILPFSDKLAVTTCGG